MSLTDLIMSEPPASYGAMAEYPFSVALQQRFTTFSRFGDPVLLYKINQGRILLPRAVCPVGANDTRVPGRPVEFTCSLKPRSDEQARVINATTDFLLAGQSGLVQCPTGFGKTAVTQPVIANVGVKTLVILPKTDLLWGDQQWLWSAKKFLGLTDNDIGIVQQDTCLVKGRKVIFAMLHSLAIPGRYDMSLFEDVGLVIWDEVHRLPADQFLSTATLFPAKLRLGLSATPERADGKEIAVYAHIGPVRVSSKAIPMKPKVLAYRTAWQCPRTMRPDPKTGVKKIVPLPHSPGKCTHIFKLLAKDPTRNKLLAEMIETAWRKKRKLVVFSHLIDHLDTLRAAAGAEGVPFKDMAYYVGGMKTQDLEAAKVKPVILTTPNMMKEGTNLPWLDACLFATPMSDIVQATGRILREYPDKPTPIIFDITDDDSPVFAGYAKNRRLFYKKLGAEVVEM